MDNLSTVSVEERINDDFSPLLKGVKKSKSNHVPMQTIFDVKNSNHLKKKYSKHVRFNSIDQKDQCNSPIKIGSQLEEVIVGRPPIGHFNNKNRNVVLGSIDKFLQKAQNMQRQLIASFQMRSTMNNSKKQKKKFYDTPEQFISIFRQTMFQLKELLLDIGIFVESVKRMFDQSKQQLVKFQQTLKSYSDNSKLKQAIDNFHNLSQEIQKIPMANHNDLSIYTDNAGFAILNHREQQRKDHNLGKIIKTNKRRMSSQNLKVEQQKKFGSFNASVIESKGDYHKISLDDINQMTNNMKKLLDML